MFHNDSQGALQHAVTTTTTHPGPGEGGRGFHADAIEPGGADVFGAVGDGTGGGGATAPPGGGGGGGDGVRALTGCVLCVLIVSTLLGNTLVCAAVVKFRHLRSKVTNSFVISLAVSDLFVAVLVMPWRAASQVAGRWLFGAAFCDTWVAFDIMCSTASILNLCVISMDRYWAISSPFRYERKMTRRFACVMIGVAWTLSVLISFIPVRLNWHRAAAVAPATADTHNATVTSEPLRADANALANDTEQDCNPSLNRTYAISSSLISFYIPVVIMVGTYTRIFRIAQTQIRRISSLERAANQRALNRPLHPPHHHHHHQSQSQSHAHHNQSHAPHHNQSHAPHHNQSHAHQSQSHSHHNQSRHRGASNSTNNHDESALKTSFKKETKVLKTLSIIMGVFVFCWLPFFVLNCVVPFCEDTEPGDPPCVSDNTFSIFVWFGWANSSLNPVIYAFNADFRKAFSTILGCNKFCSSSTVEAVDFSNELVSYHHDTTLQKETAVPTGTTATGGGGGGAGGGPGGVQQRLSCLGPRQHIAAQAGSGEELLDPDRVFGIAQLLQFECEAEISLDMMPFNSSGPADCCPAIPGQVGDL